MKRQRFGLTLGLVVFALVFVGSFAFGADRLIVQDLGGNTKFVARDDGSVMLNTATFDAPSWVKLYIADDTLVGYNVDSYQNNPSAGGGGMFRFSRGSQASKSVVQTGDRLGFFVFSGYDGATFLNTASFSAKVDGAVSAGTVPTKLVFETGTAGPPTRQERMVISSAGNVGIGTSTPTHLIQLSGGAYSDGAVWTNASSREYKENINELTAEAAIDAFTKLAPVTFSYKTDAEQHVGFIAEDVPDLVATRDRKGLSTMDIVAVLTKVVQEQRKTVEEQQKTISALQEKLKGLEGQVAKIRGIELMGSTLY